MCVKRGINQSKKYVGEFDKYGKLHYPLSVIYDESNPDINESQITYR